MVHCSHCGQRLQRDASFFAFSAADQQPNASSRESCLDRSSQSGKTGRPFSLEIAPGSSLRKRQGWRPFFAVSASSRGSAANGG
jgi:hypothetical protein